MTLQDLFNQPLEDNLQSDPTKNYIEELVGEGKKFKTIEDLARGKFEADLYVQSQNRQLDELRTDYRNLLAERTQRATLEDQLTELRQQLTNSNHTPLAIEEPQLPSYDPKQLNDLVSQRIQEHERSRIEETNYNTVMAKLKEKYGSSYASILENQIDELGLTKEDVNSLARRSPKAFFKTLGLDETKQSTFQSPVISERRSDTFSPTSNHKRTWSYYKKMKDTNPMIYLDAKTQVQMHKDRIELGDAFNDGDFNY